MTSRKKILLWSSGIVGLLTALLIADDGDVTVPRSQRIVPIVQDYKNALLLRPVASFDDAQMATLQHALIRGIEIVAELEEGELLGEPMPRRDTRNAILLYEATEGGAGVLREQSPAHDVAGLL